MAAVSDLIENKNIDLKKTEYYTSILGESPSKGAKSPLLWNAAFEKLGLPCIMHPMDVAQEKLETVVEHLRDDKRFIGGAVTMPYKISILPYLDSIELEVEIIGAVNCLYRDGNRLIGSNTDGAGALWSLQQEIAEPLEGKTVLLLGTGGAGFAVATYLAHAIGMGGKLRLANRSGTLRDNLASRLSKICQVQTINMWPAPADYFADVDVIVNCTSIGFETLKRFEHGVFSLRYYTPFGPVDDTVTVSEGADFEKRYLETASAAIAKNFKQSLRVLASMNNPIVMDIIYQPRQTMLLFIANLMGYRTINGIPMNLEQAVIAFDKATMAAEMRDGGQDEVRRFMREVS